MFCNSNSYLEQLIELICRDRKFYICIYDLSDMLKDESLFGLPFVRKFHKATFCEEIKKSSKGLHYCIKCRHWSFLKASMNDSIYVGKCYLGITEIVKPVHINGRLSSIIYLGNMIDKDKYEDTLKRIHRYSSKLEFNEDQLLNALDTVDIFNSDEINERILLVELLHNSLIFAYTSSLTTNKSTSNSINKKNSYLTQCIKDYVEEYYSSDIKIEHLASLYFSNANYLRNLFKKQTSLSFTDYLNQVRIEKAAQLLKNTNEKIITISIEVGFNNVTYFNKLFKRYKGLSPKQYRDACGG
jgi:AraC-like DNA-binding protein/ligand-binding sensor protein